MVDRPPNSYLLFSDAAPRLEGGSGGNILAWNLLQGLRENVVMVVTRAHRVYRDLGVPLFVYPDASVRWLRFCLPVNRSLAELIMFVLWLPALTRAVRRSGCHRIFAMCGNDPWFLVKADLLRRTSGLPLDVYLIDDLEESSRLAHRRFALRLIPWAEPRILRKAARVFTISPGYAEHLLAKYGQVAYWLPVLAESGRGYIPYQPTEPDRRALVFLGSINALYLDSLAEIYSQIARWNEAPNRPFELCLHLYTQAEPQNLLALLPDRNHLEIHLNASPSTLGKAVRTAWCILLPYSFSPSVETMVSTSFSTKFTESIGAGRPILVYGPAEASIPRYFREHDLPLRASTLDELAHALHEIDRYDGPELIERYQALARRNHSFAAIRQILVAE